MVAAWALLSGLLLGVAFSLWLLVFGGIAVLFYGLLLFASPIVGALALTWWMGIYALVFGGVMILLAFMLRKRRERMLKQKCRLEESHGGGGDQRHAEVFREWCKG